MSSLAVNCHLHCTTRRPAETVDTVVLTVVVTVLAGGHLAKLLQKLAATIESIVELECASSYTIS